MIKITISIKSKIPGEKYNESSSLSKDIEFDSGILQNEFESQVSEIIEDLLEATQDKLGGHIDTKQTKLSLEEEAQT